MAKSKELRTLIKIMGKMDPSLQTAALKAAAEMKKASGNIGMNWGKVWSGVRSVGIGALKAVGAATLAVATAATVAFGVMGASGLEYASDLTEVQNVVDKTFGSNAQYIEQFADTALEAYGITTLEAKNYSSVMGAMLKSMGMADEQTLTMSENLAALTGDLASFRNLKTEDAFEKIRSGISGETEPLKQLGINMSVANMQAFALSQGITQSYSSMSQADQAILRYNYLLQVTKDAHGDFADTYMSFANQSKLLPKNLQAVSGEIMQNMMPALAEGMAQLNGFITGLDTGAVGQFAGEMAKMAVSFIPLVMDLMPAMGNLLMTIMPPLLQIGQMLIPIVVQAVQSLVTAMQPLIPVFMDLVQILLPPLASLLQAVAPLLSAVASVASMVLAPALSLISSIITPLADLIAKFASPLAELVGKAAGIFSKDMVTATNNSIQSDREALGLYANGGFSAQPAIFGEDGMEAAIPIKPGNPRSLLLLQRTAQMLGVGKQYNIAGDDDRTIRFTYAPVIQTGGGADDQIRQALQQGYTQMRRMIEDFFNNKDRLAWE